MSNYTRTLILAVKAALFAALTAVCAYVSIPIFPPITLQLFAITLALYTHGGLFAALSAALYTVLGALGLPAFSGFAGGIGHLLSADGGFIIGFIVYCLVYTVFNMLLANTVSAV